MTTKTRTRYIVTTSEGRTIWQTRAAAVGYAERATGKVRVVEEVTTVTTEETYSRPA